MLAPICLFTYNRLNETKQTILALQNNFLAKESELFIFSDGSKGNNDKASVANVREYLKTIQGFKSVKIIEAIENKGLANSIIDGVSKVLENQDSVIVLEDDLVTSPNFLNFMNQALHYYKNNDKILSVSGWSLPLKSLNNLKSDFYFHHRMSSWGWGIWKGRWSEINWDKDYYSSIKWNLKKQLGFQKGGYDMPKMLKNYLRGKNNSWAIRACYHQYEHNLLTIAPKLSKVNNIGFGTDATHTNNYNRYDQTLDSSLQLSFDFRNEINLNKKIVREYKNKFSLFTRIKSKIKF